MYTVQMLAGTQEGNAGDGWVMGVSYAPFSSWDNIPRSLRTP